MKKIILFGVNRHAIAINDFYMFFSRTNHQISHIFYPAGSHKHRDWWENGERKDKARDNIVDPMFDFQGKIIIWNNLEDHVLKTLDSIDFDYICLGNGNDTDQKKLIKRYGIEKFLFSEYG